MISGIGWGILGTGQIAGAFARDVQAAGHRVAAVGSRSPEKAIRFAGENRIARAHGSYQALVTDGDVDVVYVATPHPWHAEHAMMALAAGKHVLVEKPFTINAVEARAVIDLAAAKGLVVLEAMKTRFLPHMVSVRNVVASGILGEIRSVVADLTQDLPSDPAHRINALELGGGALLDLGVYPVALAVDILGEPEQVTATARFKPTGADAQVAILLGHAGGAMAALVAASDCLGPNRAAIIGTEGRIEIDPPWNRPTSFRIVDRRGEVTGEFHETVAGRGLQFEAAEVERLIGAGAIAGDVLPPAETLAIMRTLDAVRTRIGLKYPGERRDGSPPPP